MKTIRLTFLALCGLLSFSLLQGCAGSGQTIKHGTTNVDVSSLTEPGQMLITDEVEPDGTPILVVRQQAGLYAAFSTKCTKDSCKLNVVNGNTLVCPCDKSQFDLQGQVTKGPATLPLKQYVTTASQNAQAITVTY